MEDENTKETVPQQTEKNGGEEDVDVLRQSLLEEKAKAEDYLANWQRSQADFINYKKRTEREKEEISEYAKSLVIKNILPVLDDFDRAISAVPEENVDSGWVEGVKLIERKLRNALESLGLSCIECVGECFDPYTHEAVRQDCGEEGIVLEEVQKGYKLNIVGCWNGF